MLFDNVLPVIYDVDSFGKTLQRSGIRTDNLSVKVINSTAHLITFLIDNTVNSRCSVFFNTVNEETQRFCKCLGTSCYPATEALDGEVMLCEVPLAVVCAQCV